MSVKWVKTGKVVSASGSTTITYRLEGTPYTVESRKSPIPHVNRVGTWSFTSYYVLKDGVEVAEKNKLSYAKEYAERLNSEGREAQRDG